MRGRVALVLGLAGLFGGCRNNDLVEAELRSRESEVRELKAELGRAESQNDAMAREITALRQNTSARPTPELASQTYTLKEIVLGRQTGGYDDDDCPGDEALQVVLEPHDCDGHTIKAPGSLHVEALEISPEGIKTPLSAWEVSPEQLRRSWRSGLLSTGYFVILPWKNWPSTPKLRVIARFTLSDGRMFEADKDVTVRLTAPARRPVVPIPDAVEPREPALPESEEALPAPRKVDPKGAATTPKAWWLPQAGSSESVQPVTWRPKATGSLADSVELLRPTPLNHPPGEDP
jgi:hypothetical protein